MLLPFTGEGAKTFPLSTKIFQWHDKFEMEIKEMKGGHRDSGVGVLLLKKQP